MKSFLITLTIILLSIAINAQEYQLNWGAEEKGDKSSGISTTPIGWHKENYYTFQTRFNLASNRVFYFEKIDKKLNLTHSTKLKTKYGEDGHAQIVNDKLYFIQIVLDNKDVKVIYTTFNLDGEYINETVALNINDFEDWKKLSISSKIQSSPNSEKIGFVVSAYNTKENYIKHVNGVINSRDINNIKISSNIIPISEEVSINDAYAINITNDGSMITTLRYKSEEENPYLYSLICQDIEGEYKTPIPLKFENNIYLDKVYINQNNDDLTLYSYYLVYDGESKLYNGFILANIDLKSNAVNNINNFAYTTDFFVSLGYKPNKDNHVAIFGEFDLKIIPNKEKGGGYLIGEHYEYHVQNRIVETSEMFVIPFNSNLELKKRILIPKKTISYDHKLGGLHYFAFSQNNKLYVLYNDHKKNISIKDVNDLKSGKPTKSHSVTAIATIEEGAPLKREILFYNKENGGHLVPFKCDYSDNTILLSCSNKKKIKYGILKVK